MSMTKRHVPAGEFKRWLAEVDRLCRRKFGLRLDDLPDMLTRDAFDSGVSPEDFFDEEVMGVMREEYGGLADLPE